MFDHFFDVMFIEDISGLLHEGFVQNYCRSSALAIDINGLVQERHYSSGSAMELRLSCTNPSTK